jgi:hypothetical protein
MKEVKKWTRKGECARKHGKAKPRKEEGCRSKRKIVGLWTSCMQGVRLWTNLIHLGLVG